MATLPLHPTGARERVAVSAVFAGNGALFGALFARLPEVQERLGLSEGELGVALLGAPVGLLAAVALAGAAVVRHGSRRVSALAAAGFVLVIVLPALAPSLAVLVGALLLLGAAAGSLDVAMNAQGVAVEARHPRRIFASLHAAFSFGALAGAGVAALTAAAGIGLVAHLVAVAVVVGAVFALGIRAFVPDTAASDAPAFARPTWALAALGVVALCALLAEGAMGDWAAVYAARELGAAAGPAAAGLAVFQLAMGIGRLAGDPVADRVGDRALARGGMVLAAGALAVAAAAAGPAVAYVAFAALGLGLAAVFPLCLRAAAARPGVPAAAAIAAVTTTGYVGLLAGPAVVGLVAEATSLRVSLLAIAALCLAAAVLARAIGGPPSG